MDDSTKKDQCYQNHRYTLEQRLFHALHDHHVHSPTIKEFQECFAFCNASRSFFFRTNKKRNQKAKVTNDRTHDHPFHDEISQSLNYTNHPIHDENGVVTDNDENDQTIRYIIDVAGGHGALGILFLILESKCIQRVTIIDPAILHSGKSGIRKAWGPNEHDVDNHHNTNHHGYYDPNKVIYRHECLRHALSDEIHKILQSYPKIRPNHILVVSCHACQHLSDEILQICIPYQVHIAVLPCCQKDMTGIWKTVCMNLNHHTIDHKNHPIEKGKRFLSSIHFIYDSFFSFSFPNDQFVCGFSSMNDPSDCRVFNLFIFELVEKFVSKKETIRKTKKHIFKKTSNTDHIEISSQQLLDVREEDSQQTYESTHDNPIHVTLPNQHESIQQQQQQKCLLKLQNHEQLSIATCMDLLLTGKVMSWNTGYLDVRMKILRYSITPQNRLILCRSPYDHHDETKHHITYRYISPKMMKANNSNCSSNIIYDDTKNILSYDMTTCHDASTIVNPDQEVTNPSLNDRNNNNAMRTSTPIQVKSSSQPLMISSLLTQTQQRKDLQHRKLELAYRKAHLVLPKKQQQNILSISSTEGDTSIPTRKIVIPKKEVVDGVRIQLNTTTTTVSCRRLIDAILCDSLPNRVLLVSTLLLLCILIVNYYHFTIQIFDDNEIMLLLQRSMTITLHLYDQYSELICMIVGLLVGIMVGMRIGRTDV
jgi:hypothetical protein